MAAGGWVCPCHRVPSIPARGHVVGNTLLPKRVLQKGQMGTGGPGRGRAPPPAVTGAPSVGPAVPSAAGMAFRTPPSPARLPAPQRPGQRSTSESRSPLVLPVRSGAGELAPQTSLQPGTLPSREREPCPSPRLRAGCPSLAHPPLVLGQCVASPPHSSCASVSLSAPSQLSPVLLLSPAEEAPVCYCLHVSARAGGSSAPAPAWSQAPACSAQRGSKSSEDTASGWPRMGSALQTLVQPKA